MKQYCTCGFTTYGGFDLNANAVYAVFLSSAEINDLMANDTVVTRRVKLLL